MELYKKYRPKSLDKVIGQNNSIKVLKSFLKGKSLPHTLLFSGPSGCGKTTLARILRKELKCGKYDFKEINGADKAGVDDMRNIRTDMWKAPIAGKCRVWLIDEAHKITSAGQDMCLKMLEDTPSHVYFMLATTDPQKLKKTIRTRCTEIAVRSLTNKSILKVLSYVCKMEKINLSKDVENRIIESSDGSARKALVFLNQVMKLEDEEDMIEAIKAATAEVQAIAIARALLNPHTKWIAMTKILKETLNEEPEQVRWMVLTYARKVLLSGGTLSSRAYLVIDAFRDHFYDSKHAGLAAACFEVIVAIKD